MDIPVLPLNSNSKAIPAIGFGTAFFPFTESSKEVKEAILRGIKVGYRHFDTAMLYMSEKVLGEAVEEAVRLGFIHSRDDLFITSKLWTSDNYQDRVLPALQTTLSNLNMEYIDLYLIHYPVSSTPGGEKYPAVEGCVLPMDFSGVWKAMEKCQELGLTRSIGVSNFSRKKLDNLLETATIVPAVNQVEMHVQWQQKKLLGYCREKGIVVVAYSPLGGHGFPWGGTTVLNSPLIKSIAALRCKSVAQVCLRWVYEQGVATIMKSSNGERMKENLEIFNWSLKEEDVEKIQQMEQHRLNGASMFVSEDGPYKSFEELWDE